MPGNHIPETPFDVYQSISVLSLGKHFSDAKAWSEAGYDGWPNSETPYSSIRSLGISMTRTDPLSPRINEVPIK